jgi:hypothetical protein
MTNKLPRWPRHWYEIPAPYSKGYWCRSEDVDALEAERDALKKRVEELLPLARFGRDVLTAHREPSIGDVDGASIEQIAEQRGVLAYVEVFEPCGEHCFCAEFYGSGSESWPDLCLRETAAAKVEV